MVEIYFWRFLAKIEMKEIERNTKILGGKEEKEENSRGRLVFLEISVVCRLFRTSDASSYYYLPPLTWHCYEPPVRGRWAGRGRREKDACGKSVLRDKS